MKKVILIIILILIVVGAYFYFQPNSTAPGGYDESGGIDFTARRGGDGLARPAISREYKLDEYSAGIARIDEFNEGDIRITRTRVENGTAHFYFDYKIFLDGRDITPENFRDVRGTECTLTAFRFEQNPFRVIKVSRPWETSWDTPTMAVRTVYEIDNGRLIETYRRSASVICDVEELL